MDALEAARTLNAPWPVPEGEGLIVGVTGPPGAGKSTLVDALTAEIRQRGKTVAIIAVDPSSRTTGGAILGDRMRMQRHYSDPGVFIRSMATPRRDWRTGPLQCPALAPLPMPPDSTS